MLPEEVKKLNLGMQPVNDRLCLVVESALEWVSNHTTYKVDYEALNKTPASVRLFIVKYCELMDRSAGVTSESISGLSQSFDTSKDMAALLDEIAADLLSEWYISPVRFVTAVRPWG